MQSVIPLRYCIIGHVAVEHAAHAGCACATSCASSAIHNAAQIKEIFGRRRLCRAPVACFGSVYVHVAAVIAACIVCSVLFVFVIMTIRRWQRRGLYLHWQNQCQSK